MADIRILKLTSGEELIAKVEKIDGGYTVTNPLAIQVVGVDQDGMGLQIRMLPYMITRQEGTFTLFDHAVAMPPLETAKAMEDQYLQQTSGIQLIKP